MVGKNSNMNSNKNSNNNSTPRKKTIPAAVRTACWNHHIGVKVGETVCPMGCGNIISSRNFHCGHIVAEAHGGTTDLDNLIPICQTCNTSMGTANMHDFIAQYKFKPTLEILKHPPGSMRSVLRRCIIS